MNYETILAIIAGVYEVIARIVPTVKDNSIIGIVLKVLSFISNFFSNKKKSLNDNLGKKIPFNKTGLILLLTVLIFFYSCGLTKNIECVHTAYITITVIDKNGNTYQANVPVCDTIRLKDKNVTAQRINRSVNKTK